jgi:hypothetical protein
VLAAFGAAFLIARATGHQGTATAATSTLSKPPATTTDTALAAQFVPGLTALRQPTRVHRHAAIHRVRHRNASQPAIPTVTNSSPSTTTATQAQQTTTVSSPPPSPPPTSTQPANPTSGSSGTGSGTTSVGGSGHKHHGTTKVGG